MRLSPHESGQPEGIQKPQLAAGILRREHVPAPGEWGQVFGDEVLATAILDRLLHHCEVIAINGPSYRLKNRLAAVEPRSPQSPDHPCSARCDNTEPQAWAMAVGSQ
ncbi:ATP-binding protein [Nonomuraea thailandensis]